jgi:hypothetical protein
MNKLPLRATLTLWLVLLLIVWNGIRLWTSLSWYPVLNEFKSMPIPLVEAISGFIWVIIGLLIIWGITMHRVWTSKLLTIAALAYTVTYWTERLVWETPHPNWVFTGILNLILIILVLFTIKLLAREAYERESQHQKIK